MIVTTDPAPATTVPAGDDLPGLQAHCPLGGSANMVMVGSAVLERPTLVLNRHWQPVHVATVARSLTMLWNESAHVVDPDDFQLYTWADWSRLTPRDGEPFIRTVRYRLRVP